MGCAGLSNSIISNSKKNSMKKLMLSMAAALVALSACSKSIDEPVAQTQNQNAAEQETITLHIEGEREDVVVKDQEGRALNLKATVGGPHNELLKGVSVEDSEDVPGVIYLYNDKGFTNPGSVNGLARQVTFKVKGNKVTFHGELATGRLQPGQLPFNKASIYLGGYINEQSIEKPGIVDTRGGAVYYSFPRTALRTQPGMDLSKLYPLFTSYYVDVKPGTKAGARDYYSTGHRFKLYGQFVSVRCRMTNGRSVEARYNGFAVRGYGILGLRLDAPAPDTKPNLNNRPVLRVAVASSGSKEGVFVGFSDNKTYYIKGNGESPYLNRANDQSKSDAAYTLYLFPGVEPYGGIRMAYGNERTNIFLTKGNYENRPYYWGLDEAGKEIGRRVKDVTSGKFHNILLVVGK